MATQGGGSISLDPPGGTYEQGTVVTVTAVPEPDYRFDHWEGDASGATNPLNLTVKSDIILTAVFIQRVEGTVTFSTSAGYDINLDVSEGALSVETSHDVVPDNLEFLFSPLDINISGCTAGSTITVTIDLPLAVLQEASIYASWGGAWADADALGRYDNGRTRIVIQISDGDMRDQDQAADGNLAISLGLAIPAQNPTNGSNDSSGGGCFISSIE